MQQLQTKSSFLYFCFKAACCLIDPQGTVLNSWNAVWVVLSDDGLEFYKKKTDRSPKGMIPLKGAALTSPCQDFSKRMVRKCQAHHSSIIENKHAGIRAVKIIIMAVNVRIKTELKNLITPK